MSRVRLATCGKVLFGLALGLQFGCDWVNRPIVYEDARETPPLAVPSDLVTPAPNPALQIPAVAGVASDVVTAPPTLGNTVAVARGGLPRAANAVLALTDEADSTWRRVGIALERGGCCKVLAKNQSGLNFEVELIAGTPKPGFFKRMFSGAAPSSTMTVQVTAADAGGATVTVVDNDGAVRRDDAAMTVLGVVEARLR